MQVSFIVFTVLKGKTPQSCLLLRAADRSVAALASNCNARFTAHQQAINKERHLIRLKGSTTHAAGDAPKHEASSNKSAQKSRLRTQQKSNTPADQPKTAYMCCHRHVQATGCTMQTFHARGHDQALSDGTPAPTDTPKTHLPPQKPGKKQRLSHLSGKLLEVVG